MEDPAEENGQGEIERRAQGPPRLSRSTRVHFPLGKAARADRGREYIILPRSRESETVLDP
jgi:hypothetical protein